MRFGGFGFDKQFGFGPVSQPVASAAPPPGYAAWPSLIGAEMMVNGDCSSSTGWTLGTGAAIAGGKMTLTAFDETVANDGTADTALINGATYRNVFTIDSVTDGSVAIEMAGVAGTTRSTAGTFSEDIVCGDPSQDGGWRLTAPSTATMQLDSFSVKSTTLLGVEADWAFVGASSWNSGDQAINMQGDQSSTAALTGSAATAFDAAVSTSTACLVSVYISEYNGGDISVRLLGGSWVALNVSGTGWSTPVAVSSGTGNGFTVRGDAGGTTDMIIRAFDVDLA